MPTPMVNARALVLTSLLWVLGWRQSISTKPLGAWSPVPPDVKPDTHAPGTEVRVGGR